MKGLTLLEQLILAAVVNLGDEAYSVTIRKKVSEIANKTIMFGTLYNALAQLLCKGHVTKTKGEPTPERRGRRKMLYRPTDKGIKALLKALDLQESIRTSVQDLVRSLEE